jgi:soluble lytic murein transglycosylase-like protein
MNRRVALSGPDDFAGLVATIANGAGIDPALVMAIISVESSFNPRAVGDGGNSIGLMQVSLPTAAMLAGRNVGPEELKDPSFNVTLGVHYLADQMARYSGNVTDAVAAYNAGSARKLAGLYVNSVGLPNVEVYVERVMAAYSSFRSTAPATDFASVDAPVDAAGINLGGLSLWPSLAVAGLALLAFVVVTR